MAATFNPQTNTYRIDAVYNSSTSPLSGRNESCKVKSIRWVGASDGDQCIVQNFNSSNEIWAAKASGANFTDEILIEDWLMDGFKVTTLGSGVLYVDLC